MAYGHVIDYRCDQWCDGDAPAVLSGAYLIDCSNALVSFVFLVVCMGRGEVKARRCGSTCRDAVTGVQCA